MREFIEEIKRRNVFKVVIVYLIVGWMAMQIVDVMADPLNLPEWFGSTVAMLLIIGLPFAIIFAWAFELTPEGIKREKDVDRSESIAPQTGQSLTRIALVALCLAVSILLLDKFVLNDAPQVPPAAETEVRPTIAVLPFVNMSDNKNNEYFADGLSEEMLNLLAKIPRLHVAGRTSSFQFKDKTEDLRTIGQKLNVANVLEGSVRMSGSQIRITAQLIDAENGYHLWSESYDRELTDIFAIQDEIAKNVVAAMKVTLLGDETPTAARGTDNVDAYNLFMQGQFFLHNTNAENLQKALAAFQQAVDLDPSFSRAYVGLGQATQLYVGGVTGNSTDDFVRDFGKIAEYAEKAEAIDPNNADALILRAIVATQSTWDFATSVELLKEARRMEPNNNTAKAWLGNGYLFLGDTEKARELVGQALEIDPLALNWLRTYADIFAVQGDFETAREHYGRALALSPDSVRFNSRIARTYLMEGRPDDARPYVVREPVDWAREEMEIMLLHMDGNEAAFHAAAEDYANKYGFNNSYQLAEIYAIAGDLDKTFEWLDAAVRVRDPGAPWGLLLPFFDEARKDPRWAAFEATFKR